MKSTQILLQVYPLIISFKSNIVIIIKPKTDTILL